MHDWLDTPQLAGIASISARKVRQAVARIASGSTTTWRGAALIVRAVHGRGGRSGLVYQVRADSLPLDLQQRLKELRSPVERATTHGEKAQAERNFWFHLLSPALQHPKGSRERGEAIRDAVSRSNIDWTGKVRSFSERTIQRKLDAYEIGGLAALSRAKRSDAGMERVILSRAWDSAVPFEDAAKEQIAHTLRQYVRGLHKDGESAAMLSELAARQLRKLTTAAGFNPPDITATCAVPANLIEAERQFRKVARFKSDRKAHEDAKPRIRRSRDGLAPMDIIVADIHPIDIQVRRDDGSEANPRAIAWLDLATNRLFVDVILLGKGEGVRNADVIRSFVKMVEAWGAPGALYLDNGSEYNWADFIDDALKLITSGGGPLIRDIGLWGDHRSQLIRARAYNAAAKPIEGIFAVIERSYLSAIPGWIGGDRMRKKSANVGREPAPFPGTFAQLTTLIQSQIAIYQAMPQRRGFLAGRSPDAAFGDFVAAGWGRTSIEADALRVAFSVEETRVVRQGAIQFQNLYWTCPELQSYLGDRVSILVPKYEDWSRLPVKDDRGHLLGFAEPDRTFGFRDAAGAIEAHDRAQRNRRAIAALERAVPTVNRLKERLELATDLPPPPVAPVVASISHSKEASIIAAGLNEPAAARRNRLADEVSRNQNADLAAYEKRRKIANGHS